jgi:ring-opening amidohydrolase-like protein
MPSAIEVRKVPIHSVADASELATLIDDGVLQADRVIAIIGKTEGNGGVYDYTRIIADRAFREVLVEKGAPADQVRQVPIVWSGGTDGLISPHATIFATIPDLFHRIGPTHESMDLSNGCTALASRWRSVRSTCRRTRT